MNRRNRNKEIEARSPNDFEPSYETKLKAIRKYEQSKHHLYYFGVQ